MNKTKDMRTMVDKCVKCGTCRSICPTFRVIGTEPASARGKLTLIGAYLSGDIKQTETYARHLKECTLCGACRDSCPSGVDTVKAFAAAREDLAARQGLPLAASLVFKSLLEPGRFLPAALKIASRLQGLILKDSSVESGLLPRFSLPVVGGERLLPQIAKKVFMELPEVLSRKRIGSPRGAGKKVGYYAGCGVNYLMPEVGTASISALEASGATVCVPADQVCCGMPAYAMGDVATARKMAIKNLEALEAGGFDLITTSCATCGYALKSLFKELLADDPRYCVRVEAISKKVRDVNELLINDLGGGKPAHRAASTGSGRGKKLIVTYHDPCHLNRAQGVRAEPRAIISSMPGVEFREMKFPCSCCGLGGGLSTTNYELSIEIARRKAESVRATGADVVATACPGCIVQLRDALHRFGVDAKVAHVLDLPSIVETN